MRQEAAQTATPPLPPFADCLASTSWTVAEPDTSSGASTSSSSSTAADLAPETTFYEGSGSNAELLLSLVLGATLIYLPLTLASIGRRLWISYRFTDKR